MDPPRRCLVLSWLPVFLWMAAIFSLSSISGPKVPPLPLPYADKIIHAAAYAVGGYLTARASSNPLVALAVPSAYGLLDELHQRSVPGRDSSLWDWFADCLGAALGLALRRLTSSRRKKDCCASHGPRSSADHAPDR